MRCLSCHTDNIPTTVELCPSCKVYLPGLLRDVLPSGTLLNHGLYRLDYALGRGGFGITYRALQTHLEQQVAVKEYYPQEHATRNGTTGQITVMPTQKGAYERGVERFIREGRILANLNHPHVIRVLNLFQDLGTAYLVMELIDGQTLRQMLDDYKKASRQLSAERVEIIVQQIVNALAAVHQAEVYHLDLKPENVLLTPQGKVILVDFGAARQGFKGSKTQAFSPLYAAPEVLGGKDVGPESDIFELGMIVYEMLTGELPPPALKRLIPGRDVWDHDRLEEPWRSLVEAALPLKQAERPTDVQGWFAILARARRQASASRLLTGKIRCLHCHTDSLPAGTQLCPNCHVHLPSLLRDVLPAGTPLHGGVYQIDYALGRGGFGVTYRGFNTTLEQPVAIKEFFPQEHAVRQGATGRLSVVPAQQGAFRRGLDKFKREGRILARLNHPNVVRVIFLFEERDTAYLVMELVGGQTLREVLKAQPDGRLPIERVSQIISQVVDALATVHREAIYHLDLKPENILLTPSERVVLVDFGAARQGFSNHSTQAFTLEYAPPELLGDEAVGPESDIFELGMMLHELLTGTLPEPALNRMMNDTWQPEGLADPWRSLVSAAIKLSKEERPKDILTWWENHPPKAEINLTPPESAAAIQEPDIPSPPPLADEAEDKTALSGPICPNCHQPNKTGTKFCNQCGSLLEARSEMCAYCNYANRPGVKFCENCGAPLTEAGLICSGCNYLNRPGVKFCENCGTLLAKL